MATLDDEELNERIVALMDKQKKIKESETIEKLLMPSNSLRSLYNDILSVKVAIIECSL
jgi:hypothetical protein